MPCSEPSLCLGKALPAACLPLLPLEYPCCLLSVSEFWERRCLELAQGVCWRILEGDDGWCPRSSELRGDRSSRADPIPSLLSPLLCSQSFLAGPGPCAHLELKSCILLEAFRNCQRGKADFLCCSFPTSVILHYCIMASKAKNEKSEEWVPVTLVESAMGRRNLLSSVNTAGFG